MQKTLQQYAKMLEAAGCVVEVVTYGRSEVQINHITYDSKQVQKKTMFLCKGAAFKTIYLEEAIREGAVCYICEKRHELSKRIPHILVKDIRKAMPIICSAFYNYPDRRLTLTGITGTKGKTTTTYFLKSILDAWLVDTKRPQSGLLSSIETYDGAERKEAVMTTPEAAVLYQHLKNATDNGIEHMTMEVSSQALKYHRVRGLEFEVGVFLNISEDHISPEEHEDFEDYFSAKLSFFRQAKTVCVSVDSDHAERVLQAARMAERVVTFGTSGDPDILGYDIAVQDGHIAFTVKCDAFVERFELAMHGWFNIENALAAIAAAYVLKVPHTYIVQGLSKATVNGRMEQYVSDDGNVTAIVDFAHNRLSFEKVFESVIKEFHGQKIISVFGCPGNKALNRRRDLGLVAGLFSDQVYLVPDNPEFEVASDISNEIAKYLEIVGCPYECFEDRGGAIEQAIRTSKGKTVILVLGKGHENFQKYENAYYPYRSDAEHVRRGLQAYDMEAWRKDVWVV